MGFLYHLERRIEGAMARLFPRKRGEGVHPAEIAREVVRAMDRQQSFSVDTVYVPNVFKVRLHPTDVSALAAVRRTVERDTKEYAAEVAEKRGYRFAGPLSVEFATDDALEAGDLHVDASFREETIVDEVDAHTRIAPSLAASEPLRPPDAPVTDVAVDADTQTYRVVGTDLTTLTSERLVQVIEGPDRGRRALLNPGHTCTLGRSAECDLALSDNRVSKVHAVLEYHEGDWWIRDLQSTNGTYKNGLRVESSRLEVDDEVTVGLTTLRFTRLEHDA